MIDPLLRSPDGAKRNPGQPLPHCASLHAGYKIHAGYKLQIYPP
jgi:hypothetical protein